MSEDFESMPRKRIGAGIVAIDDQRRVLLVEPTYKSNWEVPGGLVELGEPPREAVARECLEELGIHVAVGRLLVMDWVPPRRLPDDGLMMQERLSDFMCRRIEAALTGISTGTVAELQNGYPASSEVH